MARHKFPSVYGALWPNVADGLRECADAVCKKVRAIGKGTFDVWRTRDGFLVIRRPNRPPYDVYERDKVGRYSASPNSRAGCITPEMVYDDLEEHEQLRCAP